MKKVIFFSTIFFSFVFAQFNECLTDIYYANGINTSEPEAKKNKDLLEKKIRISLFNNSKEEMNRHIGKFDLAYNQTDGKIVDLLESTFQKRLTDTELIELFNALKAIQDTILSEQNFNEWYYDLKKQITSYIDSIRNNSHRVLIVAHSQGNLFTYQAYKLLEMNKDTNWMTKYIYVVSVASPLISNITPNTPVICFDNDLVCKLGMHSGIKNPVRYVNWSCNYPDQKSTKPLLPDYLYQKEIGEKYLDCISSEALWKLDWKFNIHAFSFYMGENLKYEENDFTPMDPFSFTTYYTDLAEKQILFYIKFGLDTLSKKESMWNLKTNNLKCGSCDEKDLLVTAEHKYVNNMKLDVLPFNNTDYKIYKVNDTYVAAKCGGESIIDGNENICKILLGTNEKIGLLQQIDDNLCISIIDSDINYNFENGKLLVGTIGDNYWGGHCAQYLRHITLYVKNKDLINSAILKEVGYDDWIDIKVNGKSVFVSPYKLPESCELYTSFVLYPNINIANEFKNGLNTLDMKVIVTGGGEGWFKIDFSN